jgi:gliding motility-associated-like protein
VADTIIVTVIPPVKVNAGNDTTVVINQPLQLTATANNNSVAYAWLPAVYLSNPNIYNPLASMGPDAPDSVMFKVTATTPEGCAGADYVLVKLFKTAPDIFVPSAFTPNFDGRNDVIKPIPVGIAQFYYFRVFNRWGQTVFATTKAGEGWDGTINGTQQPTGTYVYTAQGKDYLGHIISRKGTLVLLR